MVAHPAWPAARPAKTKEPSCAGRLAAQPEHRTHPAGNNHLLLLLVFVVNKMASLIAHYTKAVGKFGIRGTLNHLYTYGHVKFGDKVGEDEHGNQYFKNEVDYPIGKRLPYTTPANLINDRLNLQVKTAGFCTRTWITFALVWYLRPGILGCTL